MRVALLLFSGVALVACESSAIRQPLEFSHRAHAGNGLPCGLCHESFQTSAFAGMPTTDTCMTCHQSPMSDSAEEEKVREYANKGEEIPWQRVYRLPGDTYFSHRRHVTLARLDCPECHGDVADSAVPQPRAAVPLTMLRCTGCHAQQAVSNDCNACHR